MVSYPIFMLFCHYWGSSVSLNQKVQKTSLNFLHKVPLLLSFQFSYYFSPRITPAGQSLRKIICTYCAASAQLKKDTPSYYRTGEGMGENKAERNSKSEGLSIIVQWCFILNKNQGSQDQNEIQDGPVLLLNPKLNLHAFKN